MASRKKQEDKHLNILRELAAQPHNKKCFDCGQRGPTYVNMTIGAFVCTSCSGLLRGLNPPHRIKSISMATFSSSEIDFLQSHGNEVCKSTWLALWDSNHAPEPESRDEQKVKDFLIKKYERKVWYSSQPKQKPAAQQSVPEVKPLKQLVGETSANSQVAKQISSPQPKDQAQKPVPTRLIEQQKAPASSGFDLLGDLGSDPFGTSGPTQSSSQGFASFDQKPAQPPFGGQPTPFAGGQPTPFAGGQPTAFGRDSTAFADFSQSSPFGGQPLSSQSDPFTSVSSAPSSSVSFDAFAQSPAKQSYPASNGSNDFNAFPTQPQQLGTGSDPYKALSELDDVFRTSNTQSVFSSSATGPNAMNITANQHPNPFMSPASGTSGIAMFQQQQQMAQNPFETGVGNSQVQTSNWGSMSSAQGSSSFNTSQGSFGKTPAGVQSHSQFPSGQGFGATSNAFSTGQQASFSGGSQGAFAAKQLNAFGSSQQPGIAGGQQASFGGQQGQFGGQQGQFGGQQGQFGGQQGQFGGQQGQFGGQPGQFGGQQGSFSGQQSQFGGQQGSFGGQQGQFSGQQGQFSGQQGQFGGQQGSFGGQQRSVSGQQGSFGGQQQSMFGSQPAQSAFGSGQQQQQNNFGGRQQGQGGQQGFGANPGFMGQQQAVSQQQSFPGQQSSSGQNFGANQGFGAFGAQQPQQNFQSQQSFGKDAFGGFGVQQQKQQQQQQQFGSWGQANANAAGSFGMTNAQKSTNPFI